LQRQWRLTMNSKKAKLMRKVGKVERKDKKMYNSLSAEERKLLSDVYKFSLTRKVPKQ